MHSEYDEAVSHKATGEHLKLHVVFIININYRSVKAETMVFLSCLIALLYENTNFKLSIFQYYKQ